MIQLRLIVTTIPAAANIGVAIAYRSWTDAGGAAAQLGINLAAIVGSGWVVLLVMLQGRRRRAMRQAQPG